MRRRILRWLLCGVALLVVTGLALEGLVRWALFGEDAIADAMAASVPGLRQATSYADSRSAERWRLRSRLSEKDVSLRDSLYDPLTGWVSEDFAPGTFEHVAEGRIGDRRPVLLFGDSFARCHTEREDCWEGLMEGSPLGDEHVLLNYGVRGFGTGQISLACLAALPRFLDRDPVVVVGVLVDDDLDRAVIDFRGRAKPLHRVGADGRAKLVERDLPRTKDEDYERNGIGIRSYAWRYALFGTSLFPSSWQEERERDHSARVERVNRAILEDLVESLRAADVEFFFLVFHGRSFLGRPRYADRERFLIGELERLRAPYTLSRLFLAEDARATGRGVKDYFLTSGPGRNHLTPAGNVVVFQAIAEGIEGRFATGPREE